MENIIYTGFFVNQKEILETFPVDTEKYPNVFGHHCTHTFRPTADDIKTFRGFGPYQELYAFRRIQTNNVDVIILEDKTQTGLKVSQNYHPHITLATAEGVKPFASNNELLYEERWMEDDIIKEKLCAYPGMYTSNNEVKRVAPAAIVDIDRTLCNIIENGRSPYDWDRVNEDRPIEATCQLVRSIQNNYHIVLLTGRSEDAREGTEKWLEEQNIVYDKLLMKASDSYEKSAITKYESYVNDIKDEYDVAFAIDDDQRVVDMWSENGILCLKPSLLLPASDENYVASEKKSFAKKEADKVFKEDIINDMDTGDDGEIDDYTGGGI